MGIASDITRIQGAKQDLKTAINAKGGSLTTELIDDYAAAVTALEIGGGTPTPILMGDVTPASNVRGISVTHNFGAIPSHVFFCCLDQTVRNKKCYFSGGGIPNVSHFYFVRSVGDEIDFQARTNALTGASGEDNPCAICDLTTTTMTIGNTEQEDYVLEAGVKYYWLMW